jgi:thiol-disulfide isomerase/thioredoxin
MRVININKFNKHLLNNLNRRSSGTILFYHPQCGHCQALKPEWEKMKDLLKDKDHDIYEINGEELEHINHPIKNVVDGFPTILSVKNGKIIPFENQRNAENMVQFILSSLPGSNSDKRKSKKYLKKRKVRFNINNNNNLVKTHKILNAKNVVNSIKIHKMKQKLKSKRKTGKRKTGKRKTGKRKTGKK